MLHISSLNVFFGVTFFLTKIFNPLLWIETRVPGGPAAELYSAIVQDLFAAGTDQQEEGTVERR